MKFVLALLACGLVAVLGSTPSFAAKDPFGINVDDPAARHVHFSTVRNSGIRWVRISADWREMEPVQGSINFTSLDERVAIAKNNGLSIMLTFVFVPAWANGTSPSCIPFIDLNCSLPPTDPVYFRNFVTAVVDHYENDIKHYGIWNEPDLEVFWGGSDQQYIDDILVNGAAAVRAADSAAKVIGPDIVFDHNFFENVLDQACASIDIVSAHSYPGDFSGSANQMITNLESNWLPSIQEHCNKPFWITEFGINAANTTDAIQAQEYERAFEHALSKSYIDRLFIYRLEDHGDLQLPPIRAGIVGAVEHEMPLKPSYFSVRNFIRKVREERIVRVDETTSSGLRLHGLGSIGITPSSSISLGLLWGIDGCTGGVTICSANDNKWNAENGAVNGVLPIFNIFSAFPPSEDAGQLQLTISGLANGSTFDVYGRIVLDPGGWPRGVLLGLSPGSLTAVDHLSTGATVLGTYLGWQEWEVKFATGVVSGGFLRIYLDDSNSYNESLWSGVRIQNPDFNYSAGLVFADGFESGTTNSWL